MKSLLRAIFGAWLVLFCAACRPAETANVQSHQPASRDIHADQIAQIEAAQSRAIHYLLAHQSPDGAWRSTTYGFLKDGPSLTAHIASCVQLNGKDAEAQIAFERAVKYLATLAGADDDALANAHLIYPVYTAAETIRVLAARPQNA